MQRGLEDGDAVVLETDLSASTYQSLSVLL